MSYDDLIAEARDRAIGLDTWGEYKTAALVRRLADALEVTSKVLDAAIEFLPTFHYPVGAINEHGQEEPRAVAYRALRATIDAAKEKQ